ncbi:alcohol dehydrogenase, propanol-preferring [Streptomyces sp. DvalAA-14]|uniref:alcohol dehydrogenase catalytic domain-containing protein n=1 Tax=unclassified Streptomyces TaxID=2593676 RepID=UPI00081B6E4A|nr:MULTISPECIES: alcohol dehydrogenase catalytic domain-containing protein [unclassified Streptomyces]MYS23750.1 alcohol dehydrogenase catalytic domain-containing protein [Streptomyces sp. SID4948]SCE38257.1 alcohol dehydrogenase, propanol-preferring [Streptomyces sp. DvalAA-14]
MASDVTPVTSVTSGTSVTPVMSAAVLRALGKPLETEVRPRPVPGPGQVLIRVRAAGLCHTDLHLTDGSAVTPPLPIVLGHEIAGEVAEAGEGTAVRPGDRVLAYYYEGCGRCGWCAEGSENLCPSPAAKVGFDSDGGLSEYHLASARRLVPIADSVAFAEAAVLGCSGTTAVRAIRCVARVAPAETVAVIGAGGVGLAVVQVAVADGARVITVDPHGPSREQALRYGADTALDPAATDPVAAVRAATGAGGCDVVVDTVGSEHTPGQAVRMARTRGRVVLVGYTGRPAALDVLDIVVRETEIRGSVGATLADAHTVMEMAASGLIRGCVEAEYPLERVNEALARLAEGGVTGRLVVTP